MVVKVKKNWMDEQKEVIKNERCSFYKKDSRIFRIFKELEEAKIEKSNVKKGWLNLEQ